LLTPCGKRHRTEVGRAGITHLIPVVGWARGTIKMDVRPNEETVGPLAEIVKAMSPETYAFQVRAEHFIKTEGAPGADCICDPEERSLAAKVLESARQSHPALGSIPVTIAFTEGTHSLSVQQGCSSRGCLNN
jgi:hypothetical protein